MGVRRRLLSSHTRSRSSDNGPRLLAPTLRYRHPLPFVHCRRRISRLCRRSLAHRANVVDLPSLPFSSLPLAGSCSSRTNLSVAVSVALLRPTMSVTRKIPSTSSVVLVLLLLFLLASCPRATSVPARLLASRLFLSFSLPLSREIRRDVCSKEACPLLFNRGV